jgi:hypothetical protein
MYRLTLKYIFLISMCLSFYTHILIENSGQSYIWKTVSFILKTTFYTEGSTKHDLRLLVGNPARCCGISKYNIFMSIVIQGKVINLKTTTLLI